MAIRGWLKRCEESWELLCRRRGLLWMLMLLPLAWLYGAWSLWLRRGRPRGVAGLDVISVGNLSLGGAGKTPLVLLLCRALRQRGRRVALLTRGFGGDELKLYHRARPRIKVVLGADRLAAASQARAEGCDTAVLDDGFQRRHELARRLDILVVDWMRRDVEAHCLPAGRLREPLGAARQSQAVVVTRAPRSLSLLELRAGLAEPLQGLRLFRGEHVPLRLRWLWQRGGLGLSWLRGRRVTALSGIGNPAAFEKTLRHLGAAPLPLRFADHHSYRLGDVQCLPGSEAVVTTEKDAVKLEQLKPVPFRVLVLLIEMQVEPRQEFWRMVLERGPVSDCGLRAS